jgi:hypothetical protein
MQTATALHLLHPLDCISCLFTSHLPHPDRDTHRVRAAHTPHARPLFTPSRHHAVSPPRGTPATQPHPFTCVWEPAQSFPLASLAHYKNPVHLCNLPIPLPSNLHTMPSLGTQVLRPAPRKTPERSRTFTTSYNLFGDDPAPGAQAQRRPSLRIDVLQRGQSDVCGGPKSAAIAGPGVSGPCARRCGAETRWGP